MTSLIFPDVNVLLALTYTNHSHHESSQAWYLRDRHSLPLCRVTQMGFLRLLTTPAAVGSQVRTNAEAWHTYKAMTSDGRAVLVREPTQLDALFEIRSTHERASTKRWTDAYLSAFATQAGYTLVTFDTALAAHTPHSLLLR